MSHTDDGLEAVIFTAQGDMRQVCVCCVNMLCLHSVSQALNNVQSTFAGFGHVNATNVFKVFVV